MHHTNDGRTRMRRTVTDQQPMAVGCHLPMAGAVPNLTRQWAQHLVGSSGSRIYRQTQTKELCHVHLDHLDQAHEHQHHHEYD